MIFWLTCVSYATFILICLAEFFVLRFIYLCMLQSSRFPFCLLIIIEKAQPILHFNDLNFRIIFICYFTDRMFIMILFLFYFKDCFYYIPYFILLVSLCHINIHHYEKMISAQLHVSFHWFLENHISMIDGEVTTSVIESTVMALIN